MSFDVIMPQLGETVAEGKILAWFKSVGDVVKEGDPLFEVETDKVTVDVEAVCAGTLNEIRTKDGEIAKVGAVVALIGERNPPPAKSNASGLRAETAPKPFLSAFEEVRTPIERFGSAKGPDGVRITPRARRLIAQNKLDVIAIANSIDGRKRIVEQDVRAALARGLSSLQPTKTERALREPEPAPAGANVVPLNAIRRKTAERLAENWRNIPHVFQAIDIDFTSVETVRAKYKSLISFKYDVSLTYLPFVAHAVCVALRAFPLVNGRFENNNLIVSDDIHLGIAIDLSHNGLVVPVVRNAADLTVVGLAKAIARQIEKAKTGKLTADDFVGGTYTISNNGAFGTMFTAPIINAPQVAILSTDAIRKRAAIVETASGDFIAPRLIGVIGQSFDHRAFDGAYSAAFLGRLKKTIEERSWMEEMTSGV